MFRAKYDAQLLDQGSRLETYRNRGPIRWLVGELRLVSVDVLLGMGIFGLRASKLRALRRVIPFLLVRSDREYLSDANRDLTDTCINAQPNQAAA